MSIRQDCHCSVRRELDELEIAVLTVWYLPPRKKRHGPRREVSQSPRLLVPTPLLMLDREVVGLSRMSPPLRLNRMRPLNTSPSLPLLPLLVP